MTLIDSTAWIEYYRPRGLQQYRRWVSDAIEDDTAALNAIILTEVLAFTKTQKEYDLVSSDFSAFHWIELDAKVANRSAELGFRLRRTGVTIPATDLLIHASAEIAGASLVHHDGHFLELTRIAPIRMQTALQQAPPPPAG